MSWLPGSGGGGAGGGSGVAGPETSTDNAVVRWDGADGEDVQDSSVTISDTGEVAGATRLDVDNLRLDGNTVSSTNSNGDINLDPAGTGNVAVASGNVVLADAVKIGWSDIFFSYLAGPIARLMNAAGDSYRTLRARAFEAHDGTTMKAALDPSGRRGVALANDGGVRWDSGATPYAGSEDTSLTRQEGGVVKVTSAHLYPERGSAPSAVANAVVLYAEDNGSGKTRLMALFPTGAAQQVSVEP